MWVSMESPYSWQYTFATIEKGVVSFWQLMFSLLAEQGDADERR
jgi:hypothetical protein